MRIRYSRLKIIYTTFYNLHPHKVLLMLFSSTMYLPLEYTVVLKH